MLAEGEQGAAEVLDVRRMLGCALGGALEPGERDVVLAGVEEAICGAEQVLDRRGRLASKQP